MARRQLHALRRHEIDERIVRGRRGFVHRLHDALVGLRPGDREHVGERGADLLGLRAHAAGDDHLAVLAQRRADGLQRLALGGIEEAAGVHDDRVGARMRLGEFVPLRPQARDDALGIHERLGAAEGDEGDARRGLGAGRGGLDV